MANIIQQTEEYFLNGILDIIDLVPIGEWGAGLRKINSEFKRTRQITNVLFCYSFVIQ